MHPFDLESYLTNGVENIVKSIFKSSFTNPGSSLYMMEYVKANKKANQKRRKAREMGGHIPPFLIASITTQCNLHCKGCYARANHSCSSSGCTAAEDNSALKPDALQHLEAGQWKEIFAQAAHLGIAFILLAGGEPLLRRDVLSAAGQQRDILFPVFTNGTMLDSTYTDLFVKNRNLLPVLSIEGGRQATDSRRGEGIYDKLTDTMQLLKSEGILFGASVTVEKNNMDEVLSRSFLSTLEESGCRAVIYVEYVPVDEGTRECALDNEGRSRMMEELNTIRSSQNMVFVAFPGDEKASGGCLAAGRGFFHINAYGRAEPCPFSPYSDTSLLDVSLKEALNSPLFLSLRENGALDKEHDGGCVLFEQEEKVKELAGI